MIVQEIFSGILSALVLAIFIYYFCFKKKDGKDGLYALYFVLVLVTGTVLYGFGQGLCTMPARAPTLDALASYHTKAGTVKSVAFMRHTFFDCRCQC